MEQAVSILVEKRNKGCVGKDVLACFNYDDTLKVKLCLSLCQKQTRSNQSTGHGGIALVEWVGKSRADPSSNIQNNHFECMCPVNVNQEGGTCHYAAASVFQLNTATVDIRKERSWSYLTTLPGWFYGVKYIATSTCANNSVLCCIQTVKVILQVRLRISERFNSTFQSRASTLMKQACPL